MDENTLAKRPRPRQRPAHYTPRQHRLVDTLELFGPTREEQDKALGQSSGYCATIVTRQKIPDTMVIVFLSRAIAEGIQLNIALFDQRGFLPSEIPMLGSIGDFMTWENPDEPIVIADNG